MYKDTIIMQIYYMMTTLIVDVGEKLHLTFFPSLNLKETDMLLLCVTSKDSEVNFLTK